MMKYMFQLTATTILAIIIFGQASAQGKSGFISMTELIQAMPQFKKADSALSEFSAVLNQNYAAMVAEFHEQDSLLSGRDTVKYSKSQMNVKRQDLAQFYDRLQGYQNDAQVQMKRKQEELIAPIQKQATEIVRAIAKEHGYIYVFQSEQMVVFPPGDDLLPLAKQKLGVK